MEVGEADDEFLVLPDGWNTRIEVQTELFNGLDADGKGHLLLDDVRHLLTMENPKASDEELEEIFATIDTNADGKLTLDEFVSHFLDVEKALTLGLAADGGLLRSQVFARIRPIAETGGHADTGVSCDKRIDSFDDKSITVSGKKYNFAKEVLLPSATQQEVYDAMMPELVDAWVMQQRNCMFFAYGQTGTGKTHTMFGTPASLASDEPHEDWGVFPRVVDTCLRRLRAAQELCPFKWVLTASALELYLTQAWDLLYEKTPLTIDLQSNPVGMNYQIIERVSDLRAFIDEVYSKRTTRATAMNEGSSRSHCALILTLYQYGSGPDGSADQLCQTTFTLIDLAGSERPSKTGAERAGQQDVIGALMAAGRGQPVPTGVQGFLINYELSALATEVIKATEQHSKRKPYAAPRKMTTDTIRFCGGCMEGRACLGMVICISQAPRNGWETWFSCEMGSKMGQLKAPVVKVPLVGMNRAYDSSRKAAEKAKQELAKTPASGAPSSKFYPLRKGLANGTARHVEILERLLK